MPGEYGKLKSSKDCGVCFAKNDFNISPSRYTHTGAGEEYRPIAEIVEELEAQETDKVLKAVLGRIMK